MSNGNINLLKDTFDVDSNILKTEINLLKHTADVPNDKNVNIEKWIKSLSEPCYGKETVFIIFFFQNT